MTTPNPFSDFDEDFQKADAADIPTPGRVPESTYKFVCTTKEIKKGVETVVADHEIFVANSGSKGFKLFCEILEPETVLNPKTGEPHITKGAVLERVFWGTKDNLAYMKRDLGTILGRHIGPEEKLSQLLVSTSWAGLTFEGVVKDETYQGRVNSRISFINPWAPPVEEGAPNPHGAATPTDPKKGASSKDETKKATTPPVDTKKSAAPAKGAPAKGAAAGAGKNVDF